MISFLYFLGFWLWGFNVIPYFVSGSKDAVFGRVLKDLVQLFHFTDKKIKAWPDERICPRSVFLAGGKA